MNWFKKIASVTFQPVDAYKMSQPMDEYEIASDFDFFVRDLVKQDEYMRNAISDPVDVGVRDDVITLRTRQPLDDKYVSYIADMYEKKMNGDVGFGFCIYVPDQEAVYFEIDVNKTLEREEIPQMNLANSNAAALMEFLKKNGLVFEGESYDGSFNVQAYQSARSNNSSYDSQLREEETDGNSTDFGLGPEQFERYLTELDRMCSWIQSNNLPDQTITFS